jgi:hypothetical protein
MIEQPAQRRRIPGQGFVGTKAAGFNRNEFNMTSDYHQSRRGLVDVTTQNGIGSTLLNAPKKQQGQEEKIAKLPLYVPTQRTTIKVKDEGLGF